MATLLNDFGTHIQLTKIDKDQNENVLFPVNTASDVFVNEDGDTLQDYLPTVVDDMENPTKSEPISILEVGSIELEDNVAEVFFN